MTIILAIESSCDDTSASILKDGKILSNCVASQSVHKEYGGVVPEVASRAHQANIVPVVEMALRKAEVDKKELSAIAFTRGPGLMGSLLVGVSFAKGLALSLDIPMIEVNHIQAHILAHFIDAPQPKFPFLCLTVSGGHTQIVLVEDYLSMKILGTTIDDAAGEAFDKTGKLLGLDYPAGPIIDKMAQKGRPVFDFTEPNIANLDFSFSGLKTNILRFLQKNTRQNPEFITENLADICASVQDRIVSILLNKLVQAAAETGTKQIAIAGGVSANSGLRTRLEEVGTEKGWEVFIPKFEYCTDNAAMIAMTAYYKYQNKEFVGQEVAPLARYEF
ncbi:MULTISPECIES: tRNA (adenosine(37)-N6)-threonylcarbamoyltransferase complex transferase subunit TsaD [unclassified Aureispira]|uniref:tRNA (adenosine(37)-N6)-threonylcarbamoyltransferase complex transferase subunit TsaD n=1 Tax=unclassified Aureispira TaxID=2649989 RepID=UPI000697206B|nr:MULTISPECIES: tRNA (adenosine(37)-N6)-threonylcarbamoyltransferase complex transferase subunit TsaD [unclassified Aureispira]WMX14086.1 tRNA (adenosine(37)-N6)-threonylcarbamoyltransferase complex transferase subunit TsaD [Aureispira sp. CCB-E]